MPFRTALSGLNAASTELRVIAQNIANSNTVGYKKSRTEFADIFPASNLGTSSTTIGSGVKVSAVNQQFTQGNVNFTDNNLDLAISGQGFFIVNDNGVNNYTRAGNFGVDNQGYVTNTQSNRLQAYQADVNGNISGALGDLQLDTSDIAPQATNSIDMGLNLDASAAVPGSAAATTGYTIPATTILDFDRMTGTELDGSTFTMYDAYGIGRTVSMRYTPTAAANTWTVELREAGATVASATGNPIDFSSAVPSVSMSWDPDQTGPMSAISLTIDTSAITRNTTTGGGDTSANLGPTTSTITGSVQAAFSATDTTTYNNSTSINVFDSLGSPHLMTMYFRKETAPNTWAVYSTIDGTATGGVNPVTATFTSAGVLSTPSTAQTVTFSPGGGASAMSVALDLADISQYGSAFSVNSLDQNGYTTGRLSGIDVADTGIVTARFTNGQSRTLAQIALANFANTQGLRQLGNTQWAESFSSGAPLAAAPGSGSLGLVQSGAEEGSNVDLTEQLVSMITAQRNFQANAQVISTADTITQTIINIR